MTATKDCFTLLNQYWKAWLPCKPGVQHCKASCGAGGTCVALNCHVGPCDDFRDGRALHVSRFGDALKPQGLLWTAPLGRTLSPNGSPADDQRARGNKGVTGAGTKKQGQGQSPKAPSALRP